MALDPPAGPRGSDPYRVKAVLGPTNTGKTHLAIERLCAHSSGVIGFPLRLLAREVYAKVCAIKGEAQVALITGEERIEPPGARWHLCTAEAMPVEQGEHAFVALDEAQLAADRERGHIFTDRLLHARGRDETMLLGSATLEPMVRKLVPEAEIVGRPRFSTLSHAGAKKLSRVPPRSAIVAFSAEQVYAIAEMLRRFRGGAAVVMGALSPETRNRQVELFQAGEVDYIVATDAIGMGLNLDVNHVAFAGLSKFDGVRQRRLTTSEMAQIAGRAGRHQRDGTFGTLAGTGSHDAEFTDEEVYAIEEHRFPPLAKLFWREADPRFDSLAVLIADLEAPPGRDGLVPAPEAIDLAVLKRLSEEAEIAETVRSPATVARFWEACSLPDFRQVGVENHARFVARLWRDLRHGLLGSDFVAQAIAQLDNVQGDIDTLQGRISAIRSWAYIAQRPDWVLAKEEMTARARAVEARLSDALHARLTERFVNRRTAVLMKKLGPDAGLLPVSLEGEDVLVDGELIGTVRGFRFVVDPVARHEDHKLLLAAAERHLAQALSERAESLADAARNGDAALTLRAGAIEWEGQRIALLEPGRNPLTPQIALDRSLDAVGQGARERLAGALAAWIERELAPLAPLRRIEAASRADDAGPELRALLIRLVESGGMVERQGSGLDDLGKEQRTKLARLGVRVGALDVFVPAMVKPLPLALLRTVAGDAGTRPASPLEAMPPVIPSGRTRTAPGYRKLGKQALRLDMAEKLLREAHGARVAKARKPFVLGSEKAVSMGLTPASYAQLLRLAGFRAMAPRPLPENACGPPAPVRWRWRPPRPRRRERAAPRIRPDNAFAALAELVR
ncbi:helicase-related protein [Novosphingobium marinum]|uniref:helicase-related protein n=1 Tax=Novosphingobium marinum TaxID=1514948 RepID=UPI0015CEB3AF|nr:helicase-related protein [Novosphingobium marinum]